MNQALVLMSLFVPILVSGTFICPGQDWLLFGTRCYKIGDTLDYSAATIACSGLDGYIMMPKTPDEMRLAKRLQNIGGTIEQVWVGIKDIDSNGIWTWADGSDASIQIVTGTYPDEHCARLKDNEVHNTQCSNAFVTICQRDADLAVSTTVSTTKEPVSSIESETKVVPENLSTALEVSSHVSPVFSKTTEPLQMPTQTTKYTDAATDAATAQQTYTQTNRLRPTTISSPTGKSDCSQSSTNSCHCKKRTVANSTENQKMQTLKVSDYIWLNKCTLQPLIDSGMVNVENCPFVCKCSPKGTTTSQEDMFACVRRS